jgi:hypothetical protein
MFEAPEEDQPLKSKNKREKKAEEKKVEKKEEKLDMTLPPIAEAKETFEDVAASGPPALA